MKRGLLLALLFLGLPAVALANPIDFSSGTFSSGTISGTSGGGLDVSVVGSLATITLDTGALATASFCPIPGATCFDFSGGSVTVMVGAAMVFTDGLNGGLVAQTGNSVLMGAGLHPNTMVSNGNTTDTFTFSGGNLDAGTAGLSGATMPEPATLLLLGSGLLGLAGVIKWRRNVC